MDFWVVRQMIRVFVEQIWPTIDEFLDPVSGKKSKIYNQYSGDPNSEHVNNGNIRITNFHLSIQARIAQLVAYRLGTGRSRC